MRRRFYSKWGWAASISMLAGLTLTAIEIVGAVGYLIQQDQPSYLIAGGAVVTGVAAMLIPLAERCWRRGRRLIAAFLLAALVPALSLIFGAAVERTGGARDQANRDRQAIAQRIELKRSAEKEAKAVAESDETAAKAECATGRKGKCLGLEARADISRQRLETARTELAQAGVVPRDPQAVRLAAILPGVSEEAIALYYPLVLPISISVLGLLLIAVGAHSARPVVVPRRGKRKKRRRQSAPKPSGKVIRFPRKIA